MVVSKQSINIKLNRLNLQTSITKKFHLDDLKGKVWLAQFIFTVCTAVCPPMMFKLWQKLIQELTEEGVKDYKIVSFSVDPKVDTPEAMQEYLDMYGVEDQQKWEMLTGYTQEKIPDFAVKSFKTLVIASPDPTVIIHQTYFSLVNQDGEVVKTYNGDDRCTI